MRVSRPSHAAVDAQHLAGDVARLVGGEVDGRGGHVLDASRCSPAASESVSASVAAGGQVGGEIGLDQARARWRCR